MLVFTKAWVGITSVPKAVAPLIPVGTVAIQLKVTFPVVGVDSVTGKVVLPEHTV